MNKESKTIIKLSKLIAILDKENKDIERECEEQGKSYENASDFIDGIVQLVYSYTTAHPYSEAHDYKHFYKEVCKLHDEWHRVISETV